MKITVQIEVPEGEWCKNEKPCQFFDVGYGWTRCRLFDERRESFMYTKCSDCLEACEQAKGRNA